MATRTIRLKLVVPRGTDPERRQAPWASHAAINEAANYYERQLLLMRQQEYETKEGVVTSDSIAAELRQLVTNAQGANGKSPGAKLDEASDLLRRLYELIVPSALEGETGKAQEAGGFIGPLTDLQSSGYLGVFEKLDRLRPNWVGALNSRREQVRAAGDRWLETEDGKAWIEVAKKSAKWVKQRDAILEIRLAPSGPTTAATSLSRLR